MSVIAMYETVCGISAQMVEAARANDWNRLVALERDVAGIRRRLEAGEFGSDLSPQELRQKISLIHRILDDDAEVRRHTEPWMEQVQRFLGGPVRQHNVRHPYGSGAG